MGILDYIHLIRPSQWYKNLLIPAVGIFSIQFFDAMVYLYLLIGFILACGISGTNYIINDIYDMEKDKVHPEKMKRPLASGTISKRNAIIFGVILLIASLGCSFLLSIFFGIAMSLFFIIGLLYTFVLKNIAFVDVLTISINFIIRGLGGFVIIITFTIFTEVPTPWGYWAVFIFALFLALSKRKVDLQILDAAERSDHKKVYDTYQKQLLDHILVMMATILLMGYYFYVMEFDTTGGFLLLTFPPATYLMFRYLYLLFSADKHMGTPEKAIKDIGILISTITLILIFLAVNYLELIGILGIP